MSVDEYRMWISFFDRMKKKNNYPEITPTQWSIFDNVHDHGPTQIMIDSFYHRLSVFLLRYMMTRKEIKGDVLYQINNIQDMLLKPPADSGDIMLTKTVKVKIKDVDGLIKRMTVLEKQIKEKDDETWWSDFNDLLVPTTVLGIFGFGLWMLFQCIKGGLMMVATITDCIFTTAFGMGAGVPGPELM